MRLYHRTTRAAAHTILAHGFHDAWGYHLTDRLWYGVWLSDRPSDDDDADAEVLLAVDLDVPEGDLAEYAWWFNLTTGYRKFLLPAELIKQHGTIRIVEEQ